MLDRGVADALFFPWGSLVLFGIDKVAHYHLDAPLYTSTFVGVINRSKYNAMSAAQKQIIDAHCSTEWAERIARPWAEFEVQGRAKVRDEPGQKIATLNAEQLQAWRDAAQPLRGKWNQNVRKIGIDPDRAFTQFEGLLAKYQAKFRDRRPFKLGDNSVKGEKAS